MFVAKFLASLWIISIIVEGSTTTDDYFNILDVNKLIDQDHQKFNEQNDTERENSLPGKLNFTTDADMDPSFLKKREISVDQSRSQTVKVERLQTLPGVELPRILGLLSQDHYLGMTSEGGLVLLKGLTISNLNILNLWTRSPSGCQCVYSTLKDCACCEEGGCLCHENRNLCGECDINSAFSSCPYQGPLSDAVTFAYETKNGLNRVVLTASRNVLGLYIYNSEQHSLKEMGFSEGQRITFQNDISSLSYEEIYVYGPRGLNRRRILFVFSKLGAGHKIFEVVSDDSSISLREVLEWSRKGEKFTTFNILERLFLVYNHKDNIHVDEVKMGTKMTINSLQVIPLNKIDNWFMYEYRRIPGLLIQAGKKCWVAYIVEDKFIFKRKTLKDENTVITILAHDNTPIFSSISKELVLYHPHDNLPLNTIFRAALDTRSRYKRSTSVSVKGNPHILVQSDKGVEVFKVTFESPPEQLSPKSLFLRKFKEILPPKRIPKKSGTIFEDAMTSIKQTLSSITRNIQITKSALQRAMLILEDVIPKTGSNKLVKGVKYFYGPKTAIRELAVKYANIGNALKDATDKSLDAILQNVVRIEEKRQIKGRKVFRGKVVVKDLHTSTLNGIETGHFVTTEEPAEIQGIKYVNGISVQNNVGLGTTSRVDGIDLSQIATQRGELELGSCHFQNLNALTGIDVENNLVNQKPFKEFISSIFQNEENFTIPGSVSFTNLIVKKDLDAKSLMGVSSPILLSDIALKSKNENLLNVLFNSSLKCHDLEAQKINLESFPEDFVLRSEPWTNFGTKSLRKINFRELSVGGFVDNVLTSDIVTKSTRQEVLGSKSFSQGIKVLGDLIVPSSRIDGVDMGTFHHLNNSDEMKVIVFEKSVTIPSLIVKGKVNNLTLGEIAKDLVYKTETTSVITERKIFMKNFKAARRSLGDSINDRKITSFVDTKSSVTITGLKIFSRDIIIDNLRVEGLIDNTIITNLFEGSLYLNKPNQVVTGKTNFGEVITSSVVVRNTLNNHYFRDILTKSTDQSIPKFLNLKNAAFDFVNANLTTIANNHTINDINLYHLRDALKSEVFDDNLIIDGDVLVKRNLKLYKINDHNFKDLDILLKDEVFQTLSSKISFSALEVGGSITTSRFTSGNAILLKKKAALALQTNGDNYVFGATEWENVEVDQISALSLVNGMKIESLENDAVYLDDPLTYSVKGTKHFINDVKVIGDLDTNEINGRDLGEHLFSRTTSQLVSSKFTFNHLQAPNIKLVTFNGIDLNKLKLAQRREEIIINGPRTFGGHVQISSLEVKRLQHFEDRLTTILQDAIKLDGRKLVSEGKIFKSQPNFKELEIIRLNGYSGQLNERRENTQRNTLKTLSVSGLLKTHTLIADNLIMKSNSVLDPHYVRSNFVLVDEKLDKSMHFQSIVVKGDLQTGSMNNHGIGDYYLTKTTTQNIKQPIRVSSMQASTIFVKGRLNGFKVSKQISKGRRDLIKEIPGTSQKSFTISGDLEVNGRFGSRKLNIPHDLVLLNKKNSIQGRLFFISPMETTNIESNVNALNGMDLSFLDTCLRTYRKFFKENALIHAGNGYTYLNMVKSLLHKECEHTSYLETVLTKSLVQPHSFRQISVQRFTKSEDTSDKSHLDDGPVSPVMIYQMGSSVWMIDSLHYESCETKLLKWNEDSQKFEEEYSLGNVGSIRHWITLNITNYSIYVLGISSGNKECGQKRSSLWRATYPLLKFKKVQDLEAAHNVFIDSNSIVYIDVGYKVLQYKFQNGVLVTEKSDLIQLKLLRSINFHTKIISVRVWEEIYFELTETDSDISQRVTYMPNINDVNILTHLDDVVIILSRLNQESNVIGTLHEVFIYKELSLLTIDSFSTNGLSQITPLNVPEDDSNSTFILVLSPDASPKVFKLGGHPFVQFWEEFPVKLHQLPWALDFVDSAGDYHLVLGDTETIVTTRMKKSGRKYTADIIGCD